MDTLHPHFHRHAESIYIFNGLDLFIEPYTVKLIFIAHTVFHASGFTVVYRVFNSTLLFYYVIYIFTIKYCTDNIYATIPYFCSNMLYQWP